MYMHKWNAESPKKGQQRSTLKVNESATLVYLCFVHGFMYRNTCWSFSIFLTVPEISLKFLQISKIRKCCSIGEQCKRTPGISIIVESLLKFYSVFSLGINQNCLQTWQKAFINAILFANRTKSFDKLLYLFDCPPCVISCRGKTCSY